MDSFPEWTTRVRKDPLGAPGYNRLLERFGWVENLFGTEHILTAGAVGTAGEHNAAEIPREVGSVYITGGPTGNAEGFKYATGAARSALGTIQLALNSALYTSVNEYSLQVTSMSETGINKPCVTSAVIDSTSQISFYSKYLSSALTVGNAWAAEDANFCVAIHGPPLPRGTGATRGTSKLRGYTLTDDATDVNDQVKVDAELHAKLLIGHSAAGLHNVREIARTWAYITWDGVTLRSTSSSRNPTITTTRVGTGVYELEFGTAWALSAQPLVAPDYARNNSGVATDTYIVCCPRSFVTTTKVRYYVYKYDFGLKTWDRADTNLYSVIHAG